MPLGLQNAGHIKGKKSFHDMLHGGIRHPCEIQDRGTMKPLSPRKSPKIQAQDESKEMRFRYICRNAPRLYCQGDRSWSVQGACYTLYASALKEGSRSHWQT